MNPDSALIPLLPPAAAAALYHPSVAPNTLSSLVAAAPGRVLLSLLSSSAASPSALFRDTQKCGVDIVDTNRRGNEEGPAAEYLRYFTDHFTDDEWEAIKR